MDSTAQRLPSLQANWQCDLRDDSLSWSDGVYDLFGLERGAPVKREDIVAMYSAESREELRRLRWMRVTADVAVEDGVARYLYGTKVDVTDEIIGSAVAAA